MIYWHHRSTYGRFDDKLGRFERWGVMSVKEWFDRNYSVPNPYYNYYEKKNGGWPETPKTIKKPMVSRATFFRTKNLLIDKGLIEPDKRLRRDHDYILKAKNGKGVPLYVTALWIKPTEELCRIVFEPGYWDQVRDKYAYVKTKKKPRGVHAIPKNETTAPKNETSGEP